MDHLCLHSARTKGVCHHSELNNVFFVAYLLCGSLHLVSSCFGYYHLSTLITPAAKWYQLLAVAHGRELQRGVTCLGHTWLVELLFLCVWGTENRPLPLISTPLSLLYFLSGDNVSQYSLGWLWNFKSFCLTLLSSWDHWLSSPAVPSIQNILYQ